MSGKSKASSSMVLYTFTSLTLAFSLRHSALFRILILPPQILFGIPAGGVTLRLSNLNSPAKSLCSILFLINFLRQNLSNERASQDSSHSSFCVKQLQQQLPNMETKRREKTKLATSRQGEKQADSCCKYLQNA
ncbi:unnamed protein product [Ceratitis capitata]|uniref:(Mediterranean fruit fly) hypothetical protein n=1 Tax=Ceratitis capitata TaxID=7213 RepID=A0A811UIY2_CERCA|nr:unnamed protein product [Ceratitis capitata]